MTARGFSGGGVKTGGGAHAAPGDYLWLGFCFFVFFLAAGA